MHEHVPLLCHGREGYICRMDREHYIPKNAEKAAMHNSLLQHHHQRRHLANIQSRQSQDGISEP
jgi:hypothetical protein